MHYKASDNTLHFLDNDAFAHLLPAGSIAITDEEAEVLRPKPDTKAIRTAEIYSALDQLDKKLIRPLSEGETAKVSELVMQKQLLRQELASL